MDRNLKFIIDSIQSGKQIKFSYDALYDVFRKDYNPEKGQTPRSELDRWLNWASTIYKFEYFLRHDEGMGVYYFRPL